MATESVQVKIGVDNAELKTGLNAARRSVEDFKNSTVKGFGDVKKAASIVGSIGGIIGGFTAGVRIAEQMANAFKGMNGTLSDSQIAAKKWADGLDSTLGGVTKAFAEVFGFGQRVIFGLTTLIVTGSQSEAKAIVEANKAREKDLYERKQQAEQIAKIEAEKKKLADDAQKIWQTKYNKMEYDVSKKGIDEQIKFKAEEKYMIVGGTSPADQARYANEMLRIEKELDALKEKKAKGEQNEIDQKKRFVELAEKAVEAAKKEAEAQKEKQKEKQLKRKSSFLGDAMDFANSEMQTLQNASPNDPIVSSLAAIGGGGNTMQLGDPLLTANQEQLEELRKIYEALVSQKQGIDNQLVMME